MFKVKYHPEAALELRTLRAHDRARILDAIEKVLFMTPLSVGRKVKRLDLSGGVAFQLRVADFRIFYDVDVQGQTVVVRHVRRKGRLTTGEVV